MDKNLHGSTQEESFLQQAVCGLQDAFDEKLLKVIMVPQKEITFELVITRSDRTIDSFQGCRVQHNNYRGPYKGGIRFDPTLNLKTARALSELMTWKTALAGIPFGGAKGGITCNPKELTVAELEGLTKAFTERLSENIGPNCDIPAPDVGTDSQVMSWMFDRYTKRFGYEPAAVTGKPPCLGGLNGRSEAPGRGVAYICKWLSEHERSLQRVAQQDCVIQGFGHVGQSAALQLQAFGSKVVGISDSSCALYNENGIAIAELVEFTQRADKPRLVEWQGAGEKISNQDLLSLKCNILIPAATHHVLDSNNACSVQADAIVEAANMPLTFKAHELLEAKGITIVPDILANSGGVIASYFEWAYNIQRKNPPPNFLHSKLSSMMNSAFNHVSERVKDKRETFRMASYRIAIERVLQAGKLRGFQ